MPFVETLPVNTPISPYAASKKASTPACGGITQPTLVGGAGAAIMGNVATGRRAASKKRLSWTHHFQARREKSFGGIDQHHPTRHGEEFLPPSLADASNYETCH